MVLWWIGNAVLVAVVLPAVVVLLRGVYTKTRDIDGVTGRIEAGATGVARQLEAVPELVKTRDLAVTARQRVARYGAALEPLVVGAAGGR